MSNFNYSIHRIILFICFQFALTSASPPGHKLVNDILRYTNEFRRSNGLPALVMRNDLNSLAQKHSADMASGRRSFGHGGFDQRTAKVSKIYNTCTMAENVAYGARNAKEVISIWKNSSIHRKNMLGKYKYVGIGTAKNKRGVIYYTEIFIN